MTARRSPRAFSPAELRRLAKNPFVDEKMLQFVKGKTLRQLPVAAGNASPLPPLRKKPAAAPAAGRPSPLMNEKTALLIAAALKTMMQK